jgi:hypothetical protein
LLEPVGAPRVERDADRLLRRAVGQARVKQALNDGGEAGVDWGGGVGRTELDVAVDAFR